MQFNNTEALAELMDKVYDETFNSDADVLAKLNSTEDCRRIDGLVMMRGISFTKLDFSKELERAIGMSLLSQTGGFDDKFWDELIAKEPVMEAG